LLFGAPLDHHEALAVRREGHQVEPVQRGFEESMWTPDPWLVPRFKSCGHEATRLPDLQVEDLPPVSRPERKDAAVRGDLALRAGPGERAQINFHPVRLIGRV